uniref:Uncharacterized protein n=1 Tax=Tetradesmus obliquus TaxID=3088 RepID=A0A383VSL9_TETOB|eukprot:jgi/Sobl393_1/16437/SZX67819.1
MGAYVGWRGVARLCVWQQRLVPAAAEAAAGSDSSRAATDAARSGGSGNGSDSSMPACPGCRHQAAGQPAVRLHLSCVLWLRHDALLRSALLPAAALQTAAARLLCSRRIRKLKEQQLGFCAAGASGS